MKGKKTICMTLLLGAFILLSGFSIIDHMMCEIFGWIPGYHCADGSSSGSSSTTSSSDSDDRDTDSNTRTFTDADGNEITYIDNGNNKPNLIDRIKDRFSDDSKDDVDSDLDQDIVEEDDWNCDHIPNSIENSEGTCVCKNGFGWRDGRCIPLGRECYSDLDCGNGVRSRCSGNDKIVYQCELVTNRCFPAQRVSCTVEYGAGYTCRDGNCIQA